MYQYCEEKKNKSSCSLLSSARASMVLQNLIYKILYSQPDYAFGFRVALQVAFI